MRHHEDEPGTPDKLTPTFTVQSELRESSLAAKAAGELDMAAAFKLESELDPLLSGGDVRTVDLDLGDVRFVDSAGLGALLAIRERASQLGIELAISRVSDPVHRLLWLTGNTQELRD